MRIIFTLVFYSSWIIFIFNLVCSSRFRFFFSLLRRHFTFIPQFRIELSTVIIIGTIKVIHAATVALEARQAVETIIFARTLMRSLFSSFCVVALLIQEELLSLIFAIPNDRHENSLIIIQFRTDILFGRQLHFEFLLFVLNSAIPKLTIASGRRFAGATCERAND